MTCETVAAGPELNAPAPKMSSGPEYFNEIANHPAVFPSVTEVGQGSIDFTPAWGSLLGFEFEDGGFLLQCHAPGYYEAHSLFLPGHSDVLEKAKVTLNLLFSHTDAVEVVTKVPEDNPSALALAKAVGFRERFRRNKAWRRFHGCVDVFYLALTLDDFVLQSPVLPLVGAGFHKLLGDAHHVDHAHDIVHDAYVGAAVACGLAGNLEKGVWLYNRWAMLAGYLPIEQVTETSVMFDGVTATITPGGELTFEEVR
ncbi:hypothetical protein ABU614_19790 [Lysobacter firmicutimachus]|uniref:N-acetyltransferase n=1 Tax=Lysobacter firmicutimachus TaxID=1792846 RepID=A0AAU8MUT7_9GAMM